MLENYETVKARKKRFYQDYPDGRIIVSAVRITQDEAVIEARVFKNADDQAKYLPLATGHAQEFKGVGGPANRHAWCENCEESAVGRALDNAGYSGNDKCSREEIEKVQRAELAAKKEKPAGKFDRLLKAVASKKWTNDEVKEYVSLEFKAPSVKALKPAQLEALVKVVETTDNFTAALARVEASNE